MLLAHPAPNSCKARGTGTQVCASEKRGLGRPLRIMDTAREGASVAARVRETGRTCRGPALLFLSPPPSLRLYRIPETRSLYVHMRVSTETHTTPYLQHAPVRVYTETHKACTCAYGQWNTCANTRSRCTCRHVTRVYMHSHRHEYTTQLLIAQIHTEHPLCVLPILGLGLYW